tara:strand:- start:120 stop:575 length:456 start_codon:yes stop_codon:yes gene_type:complete
MRQGYIYYILDLTNADMYIGACWKSAYSSRKSIHKNKNNNDCCSKKIIKNNNYIFEILEENNFIDRKELHKREQYYMDNNICINEQNAYGRNMKKKYKSNKDWKKNNKEKVSNQAKIYYQKNKERIAENQRIRINVKRCVNNMITQIENNL